MCIPGSTKKSLLPGSGRRVLSGCPHRKVLHHLIIHHSLSVEFLPLMVSDQFIILLNDHCNLFHSNYHTHGCNTLGKVIYYMYITKHTRKSEKDI